MNELKRLEQLKKETADIMKALDMKIEAAKKPKEERYLDRGRYYLFKRPTTGYRIELKSAMWRAKESFLNLGDNQLIKHVSKFKKKKGGAKPGEKRRNEKK